MSKEENTRVINAIKDRAIWFALLWNSFAKIVPRDQLEKCAREAIAQFGVLKAKKDGRKISPKEWTETHRKKGSAEVFRTKIKIGDEACEQMMTYCPLLEAWKEMGVTPEEQDLFCDIAMEADRARANEHNLICEIPCRLGRGDVNCRLILREKK